MLRLQNNTVLLLKWFYSRIQWNKNQLSKTKPGIYHLFKKYLFMYIRVIHGQD